MRHRFVSQGSLFKASKVPEVQHEAVCRRSRGPVQGMSRRSRKRLLESFARLRQDQTRKLWCTLTYSDAELPSDAREFQRDLDAFERRLRRRYPAAAVKWVKQFDSSGAREWHPHLHFVLYNLPWLSHALLEELWGHGYVWVEALISDRQAAAYAARYCASLDYVSYQAATGRMWGEWNRDALPWAVPFVFEMESGAWFHQVKRSARHVWPGVNRKKWAGFTLFRDDPDAWVNLVLEYAAGC